MKTFIKITIFYTNVTFKCAFERTYEAKCAVYGTYTDNPPPMKPLSEEEAFKPIRNAMIKEADELGKILLTMDDEQSKPNEPFDDVSDKDDDKSSSNKGSSKGSGNSSASGPSSGSSSSSSPPPKSNTSYTAARNRYIATSVTRFGNSLSRIFRERFDEQESKIAELLGGGIARCNPPSPKEQMPKELAVPKANTTMNRVYAYLMNERYISRDVIQNRMPHIEKEQIEKLIGLLLLLSKDECRKSLKEVAWEEIEEIFIC